jgi:glutathione peroxidase
LVSQYPDFNRLVSSLGSEGFHIAAFPCNQFYMLEPGNNGNILPALQYVRPGNGFVPANGLKVFGKLNVNGKTQAPLYAALKSVCPPTQNVIGDRSMFFWEELNVRDITWNYEKILVDYQGVPRYRFAPGNWANGTVVMPYIRQLLNERKAAGL